MTIAEKFVYFIVGLVIGALIMLYLLSEAIL